MFRRKVQDSFVAYPTTVYGYIKPIVVFKSCTSLYNQEERSMSKMRSRFQSYVFNFGVKLTLLFFMLISLNFFFESARRKTEDQNQQVSYPWIAGDLACQIYSIKVYKTNAIPVIPLCQ